MNTRVEKACGIDVHQAFLAATILTSAGTKDTREFSTCLEGLLDLKTWILENGCQRVAIESTGIYHIPAYTILEGKVETIVANPLQIKYIPGRNNDDIDSEWIAEVILNGIMDGKSMEQIIDCLTDKRIKNKKAEIKDAIKGELSQNDIFVIKECLETVKFLDTKIEDFDSRIFQSLTGMQTKLEILMSIPGIGFTIAAAAIAEIGDIKMFPKPKNLVSWSGLAPAVNESAGKSSNGHITKHGNKYLRTILVQAANSIAIGKPNKLRLFYQRIKSKKGHKKAIVALARKLASIIHHLLSNNEKYSEEELKEKKAKLPKFVSLQDIDMDGMIEILCEAGYTVNKSSSAG